MIGTVVLRHMPAGDGLYSPVVRGDTEDAASKADSRWEKKGQALSPQGPGLTASKSVRICAVPDQE